MLSLTLLLLLAASSCQPVVHAFSISPDGKHRCEVYEGQPSFLWGPSFRYYFSVIQITPYASLKKPRYESFEYHSDIQVHEGDFNFKWSGQQVEVTIVRGGNQVARMRGEFNEREQRWTRVE